MATVRAGRACANIFKQRLLLSLCLYVFVFLADKISCRSYVGSVYRIRSLAVSRFSLLLTTIRSQPAMSVHVSTVWDSSTTQATKLLLRVVFFFSNCRNRLSSALSAAAQTTTNLLPSMSSKQTSFSAKFQAVKFITSTSIIWSLIILK